MPRYGKSRETATAIATTLSFPITYRTGRAKRSTETVKELHRPKPETISYAHSTLMAYSTSDRPPFARISVHWDNLGEAVVSTSHNK